MAAATGSQWSLTANEPAATSGVLGEPLAKCGWATSTTPSMPTAIATQDPLDGTSPNKGHDNKATQIGKILNSVSASPTGSRGSA